MPVSDEIKAPKMEALGPLAPYRAPTRGILSILPSALVPYGQLMRIEKPAGYWAIYFPHAAGFFFAQAVSLTSRPFEQMFLAHLCIVVGCVFLRGAACTWNDVLDAPFDRQVERCRLRPIARYAVSSRAALLFMAIQIILGVVVTLAPLPHGARVPAALLTGTQIFYPLFKRFTNYPQLWLGSSFALGLGVGAGAGGLDLGNMLLRLWRNNDLSHAVDIGEKRVLGSLACFFAGILLNTLIYDTIYGHQDLADDVKAGVKSVAVAWREKTKRYCAILAVVEVALLASSGLIAGLGAAFVLLAAGGTAGVLATMLYCVRLEEPTSCMWCFQSLIWGTGIAWNVGLLSACIRWAEVWEFFLHWS